MLRAPMVSATQQTSRIRQRKARREGTVRKRYERAHGTPKFPVHLPGYDPSAPDAPKTATQSTAAQTDAKK
ncbi:Hypothetical protein CAP_4896 [Chondromyces apiculatus DSM 436]|uniref:Uncharacterized protein n=2 Tax=Chondromyces apiculatus TaxID=51 RepID=A0A017T4U5_9BACT|nr:Hypothetical protein CAP_4896 [Chondromyces apiculatus DSM 436]